MFGAMTILCHLDSRGTFGRCPLTAEDLERIVLDAGIKCAIEGDDNLRGGPPTELVLLDDAGEEGVIRYDPDLDSFLSFRFSAGSASFRRKNVEKSKQIRGDPLVFLIKFIHNLALALMLIIFYN